MTGSASGSKARRARSRRCERRVPLNLHPARRLLGAARPCFLARDLLAEASAPLHLERTALTGLQHEESRVSGRQLECRGLDRASVARANNGSAVRPYRRGARETPADLEGRHVMKLSAKTGVALAITALSLVVTVGAGASDSVEPVDAWVMHCCTAYSEAGPAIHLRHHRRQGHRHRRRPVNARVISCCTAYSEAGPAIHLRHHRRRRHRHRRARGRLGDALLHRLQRRRPIHRRHAASHIRRHAAFHIGGPRRDDEPASQPDRAERDRVGLVERAGERPGERRRDPVRREHRSSPGSLTAANATRFGRIQPGLALNDGGRSQRARRGGANSPVVCQPTA